MKLTLILVFVFSLGVLTPLAEKIPQHDKTTRGTASNGDPSLTCHDASSNHKKWFDRKVHWRKVNQSSPVCFGARNNQFGRFYVPLSGNLAAIMLVHRYGYVSCNTQSISHWSHWGCGDNTWNGVNDMVDVIITNSDNHILLPPNQFITIDHHWSKIPGYNSLSKELVLSVFSHPHGVTSGQELRLWYGQDLMNDSEENNGGRVCCDVYVDYV